jgi:hypothetical protein
LAGQNIDCDIVRIEKFYPAQVARAIIVENAQCYSPNALYSASKLSEAPFCSLIDVGPSPGIFWQNDIKGSSKYNGICGYTVCYQLTRLLDPAVAEPLCVPNY